MQEGAVEMHKMHFVGAGDFVLEGPAGIALAHLQRPNPRFQVERSNLVRGEPHLPLN